jgi:hypothetical protein
MFAGRYFPTRYFVAGYWAKVGSNFVHVIAQVVLHAPRRLTSLVAPARRYLQAPRRKLD